MPEKKIPQRMCLGCRCMKPKNELLRVVRSPEGVVSFDETGKAPGRGAYVCKNPECFKKIMKTKALSRTLKAEIPVGVQEALQEAFNALIAANSLPVKQET